MFLHWRRPTGASIPLWDHDAFSPSVSDFPHCFRKNFRFFGKFIKFDLFPKKFPIFIRQNFWWPFFSHRPQILNSPPILPVLVHFLSDWRKLLFPPYFHKFPPLFSENSPAFYILCVYFLPLTLTMMHLCITQCTYWTPLDSSQTSYKAVLFHKGNKYATIPVGYSVCTVHLKEKYENLALKLAKLSHREYE